MIPAINRLAWRSPSPTRLRKFYESLGFQFLTKSTHCTSIPPQGVEVDIRYEPYLYKIHHHLRVAIGVDSINRRINFLRNQETGEIIKVDYEETLGQYAKIKDPDGNIIMLTEGSAKPMVKQLTIVAREPGKLRRFFEEIGIPFITKNGHYTIKLNSGLNFSIATEPDFSPTSDHCRLGLMVENVTKSVTNLRTAEVGEIVKAVYQCHSGAYAKLRGPDGHVVILTEGR